MRTPVIFIVDGNGFILNHKEDDKIVGRVDGDSIIDTTLTHNLLLAENEQLRTALYQISEDAETALKI